MACTYKTGPILCYEQEFLKMKFKVGPVIWVVPLYISHSLVTNPTFYSHHRYVNTHPCKNIHIYPQSHRVIFNCSVGSLFPRSCFGNDSMLSYRGLNSLGQGMRMRYTKWQLMWKMAKTVNSDPSCTVFLPVTMTKVNSQLKKNGIADYINRHNRLLGT